MDAKTKKKPTVPALQQKKSAPAPVKQQSFVRKPTINIESAQVEYKEIAGDTPVATTKGSITDIGDSVLRTFREEEYDEGAAKKNLNIKVQQNFNNQDINKVSENSAKKTVVTQEAEEIPLEDSANLTSDKGENNEDFSPSASPIRTSPIKVRDLLLRNADHVSNNFQFNFEKLPIHESVDPKLTIGSIDEHQYSPPQTIQKKNGDDNSGLITDDADSFFTRRTQVDYASQRNYEADTSIGAKKDSVSVSKIIQEALARAKKCRDSVNGNGNKTRDRPSIPRNPASNFNSNRTQISQYTGNESPPQYNSLRGYSVERRSMTEADSPPHRASYQNPAVASLLNKYTSNSSQRVETVPDYETPDLHQRYSSLTKSSTHKQFGLPLPIPSNRTDVSYSSTNRVNTDQTDYARAESPVPYARINLSVKRSMSAARDRGTGNQKPLDLNTILEQYRKEDDGSGAPTYTSTRTTNPYETPQRILKAAANPGLKLNISREEKSVTGNSTVESSAVKTQPDSSAKLQPSSFNYRQINAEIEERIRRAIERTNHTRELVKRQESNSPSKIAQATTFSTATDNAVIALNKCEE